MGYISSPRRIPLQKRITGIAAGWSHSLALDHEGRVYSWGFGEEGQLGHGCFDSLSQPQVITNSSNVKSIYAGHSHSAYIDSNEDLYTFGCNVDYRLLHEGANNSEPTLVFRKVKSASLGVTHTCIITCNHAFMQSLRNYTGAGMLALANWV